MCLQSLRLHCIRRHSCAARAAAARAPLGLRRRSRRLSGSATRNESIDPLQSLFAGPCAWPLPREQCPPEPILRHRCYDLPAFVHVPTPCVFARPTWPLLQAAVTWIDALQVEEVTQTECARRSHPKLRRHPHSLRKAPWSSLAPSRSSLGAHLGDRGCRGFISRSRLGFGRLGAMFGRRRHQAMSVEVEPESKSFRSF